MIRIVFENIFFFLLPTFVYIAWVAFKDDEWPGLDIVMRRAPLFRLFIAGAALMLITLVAFSSRSHNSPEDVYVPQSMHDEKGQPGHAAGEAAPQPDKP
jgi:hypothetical protein